MRNAHYLGILAGAGLLIAGMAHAEDLKSGPGVGSRVSAFHPTHVTGPGAGGKGCLV